MRNQQKPPKPDQKSTVHRPQTRITRDRGYTPAPYNSYTPQRKRRINKKRFTGFLVVMGFAVVALVFGLLHVNQVDFITAKVDPTPTIAPSPFVPEQTLYTGNDLPAPLPETQPDAFEFTTEVEVDGQVLDSYSRIPPISFEAGSAYAQVPGVVTFRGNNYRDTASYGAANIEAEKLEKIWSINTGSLNKWSGSGWTGQPLIVHWDETQRDQMNLYPEKKAKQTLVEVIYPTMDGNIYFLDLDDGTPTREAIHTGYTVKGTASLDPRGYPLLYVGQGVGSGDYESGDTYFYIYSLLTGDLLYKYGAADKDPFSLRESWQAYDSSPLISAQTDTLIWPGENGVLYTLKLNTEYDRAGGMVSVSPSNPVKYRYTSALNFDDKFGNDKRWWGFEGSAAIWKNYLYIADNGGWLQCINLNTMQPVFVQDVTDDTDSTVVLDQDENGVYLYTASEVDKQVKEGQESGTAYVRKINALNGEILWENAYTCMYVNKVDGGVLATPALGRGNLQGMVFCPVARVESRKKGLLEAYDTQTGNVIWSYPMSDYAWSSPVIVYTTDGTGYIIQCDSAGKMILLDGKTGKQLHKISLGRNVEASPAVYNNTIVVGTRGEKIYGVRIK